jgi:hypothetical protein
MSADFLLDPGTSGFIATPFNLLSTELNAIANAGTATSSVGGTSGVFTQTNFANAQWVLPYWTYGAAFGTAPTAGANLTGWWLMSPDGGTTFEATVSGTALPRPPDFIIPVYLNITSTGILFGPVCRAPWTSCKVLIQNNTGQTLPATGNLIKCGPVAERY